MLNDLKNERNNFEKFNFSNNEIFKSFLYSLLNFKISRRLLIAIFASLDLLILSLKEVLLNYLSSQIKNFETSEVCELINLFFINLNHNLKPYTSTYFLRKYFNERNDRFVAPIPKMIGGRWDKVYNKVKNRYEEIYKTCEFYYVPIKETILQLFKLPTFCEAFFNRDHECIEGVHQKFCCGKVYKKNDFHRNNEHTIRLQLYYDDFTLTNSKNNKTIKLGAIYLQLENLPSFFTSHIDNIHLVALFHTVDLKNFGESFNSILYPIIEDIKELEEDGIFINNQIMRGTLVTLSADNQALHTALGFLESHSSNYYCHHCKMRKDQASMCVTENENLLRTTEEYRTFFENKRKVYEKGVEAKGWKRYTYIDTLKHFDIQKHMTIDIMHDLAEGSIPLTIKKFLQKAIALRIISLDVINEIIVNFDYGFILRNDKPTEINFNDGLGNSASQKLVLFLNFPFIFPKLVTHPLLQNHWLVMKNLIAITKICLKPVINDRDLNDLSIYIQTYLENYLEFYDSTLIPKQHFLTHYVRVIQEVGPPLTMWTMR